MTATMTKTVEKEIELKIRKTPQGHKFDYAAIAPSGETVGFFHRTPASDIYTLVLYGQEYLPSQAVYHIVDGELANA